jgi:hypothetical protein
MYVILLLISSNMYVILLLISSNMYVIWWNSY